MENSGTMQPLPSKEFKPILLTLIEDLNSKTMELKEYLFQIQDLTSTINSKIKVISNLEPIDIPTEKLMDKPSSKEEDICVTDILNTKVQGLNQLLDIAHNIITRQSRIYENLKTIA